MASSGNLTAAFDVVRRTSNAHASAIDALERAFHAERVRISHGDRGALVARRPS
jgi:hypothetical protein